MATSLFEIPEWLDYANFDNYPSEENPTTNADFINYARNQNKLVGALVAAVLWQPNTNFIVGKIIISPNMPEGMEAVALTGGVTGTAEPAWEIDTEEYQDSGVKWKLRWKHWSKSVEEIADLTTVATNRLPNTTYAVGNVVYVDSNLSVALKCITAGTTSNAELNISTKNIGDTVTDGSVVWQVCNRTSDVTSVNGKTGDVVVDLPVGHMYWSVEPNVPAGRLPTLGATYNRALYADLWAWANEVGLVKSESEWQAIASANDGNCAYYSSGDGSTTFRVPKLPTTSGIVAKTSATKITGQWLIVAFGVAHNIGEADVADVMSAVEQVQTGLGVVEGKIDKPFMPNYSAGVSVSGNGFTASADGIWVFIAQKNSAGVANVEINNVQTAFGISGTSGYQDQSGQTVPLKKGDVISWTTSPTQIHTSTFYPYSR